MSNLLPKQNKKFIKREYLLRLLTVSLSLSLVSLFLASVFLTPSFFLSETRAKSTFDRIDFLKSYIDNSQKSSITSLLISTNEKINVLNLSDEDIITDFIKTVISEKRNTIKINSFSFRNVGGNKTIFIEGNAISRDELISFSENLESTNKFSKVDLPISNLAKNSDIDFSLRLELASVNSQ